MHGRIKVKTTAEQEEAKRIEREKKLKKYNQATQAVFQKRNNGKFDEEGLHISGEILAVNPDFYTLWNFRKEVFLELRKEKSEEDFQKLLVGELYFLESCLKVNPKSYGTWHHRCFVMDIVPDPDWARELQLCSEFLSVDERNFHCWDYRRHVVLRSDVDLESELDYTTQKIQNNFSNYSSWHYRSKLLPVINPDRNNPVDVQEDVLMQEFEVVQNAVFTDPDDQSAWFYQRWLLGRGKKKLQICSVHVSRSLNRIIVLLSRPILLGFGCDIEVNIDTTPVEGHWRTVHKKSQYSTLWALHLNENAIPMDQCAISVTLVEERYCTKFSEGLQLNPEQEEVWMVAEFTKGTKFSTELSALATSTMEQELEGIKELHSLEPNNKWVLLTMLYLMWCIDPLQSTYKNAMQEAFDKLLAVDPMRKHYYQDIRSKLLIESLLESEDSHERSMKLNNKMLTCLYHTDWMVLTLSLDLSHNALTSVYSLSNLQCINVLNLDGNKLTEVKGLGCCITLKELSIKKNEIECVETLKELSSCSKLERLNVAENPFSVREEDTDTQILSFLKSLKMLNGKDVKIS